MERSVKRTKDLTAGRKTEAGLEVPSGSSQESHFRHLIETAADTIAVLNFDGTFRYISPSVQRIVGYSPAELTGTDAFSYMHEGDAPEQISLFSARISNSEPSTDSNAHSFRFRHKDGHWVVLEAVSTTLAEGPEPPGIVVNARDITKRAQATDSVLEDAASVRRLVQEGEVLDHSV